METAIKIPQNVRVSTSPALAIADVLSSASSQAFLMDCLQGMRLYPDNYFDLAVVDPPYGIGAYWMKQKHTYHYGKKEWNEAAPGQNYFDELFRVSKNQIIWGGNYFTDFLPVTNSWIFWDKGNDVKKMNTSEGEMAWTSFNIPMRKVFVQWSGARKGSETGVKCIHPCQRPIALHDWTFREYAERGQRVLDTHLGSGSSRIAASKAGLHFTGFEIDEEYFEAHDRRWRDYSSQLRLL